MVTQRLCFLFLLTQIFLFMCFSQAVAQQVLIFPQPAFKRIQKQTKISINDSLDLKNKLYQIQLKAWKKGYISFNIDSISQNDSLSKYGYVSLGPSYKYIQITISKDAKKILRQVGISPHSIEQISTTPQQLSGNIKQVLHAFESEGYPFASVRLDSLHLKENQLQATMNINLNARVKWNEIIVQGKKVKLSPKYIQNFLHIKPGDWYDQSQVNLISLRLSQLIFVKETKPAEVLFTPEGANLYVYIETKPVSLFNGTIGLQRDPVKLKYQLTGDLRLKLQNTFKHGELFDLSWRSIQPGSPQLKIVASYPFLFNTPFGLSGNFSLFKRDTTFLELKTTIGVQYNISGGKIVSGFYKNLQSSILGTPNVPNYGTTKSNVYGLSFTNQSVDYLPNPRKGVVLYFEGNIGKRKLFKDSTNYNYLLYGGKAQVEYYQSIGKRFVIKSQLHSETFFTANIQQNELLRFGGNLSQRGFMEDELMSTFNATFTLEPRFILDQNSYLFVFYDQSWYERNVQNYVHDAPFGFGAGMSFGTKIGIFSLTYALGKQFNNPILFRDSKVHFGYVAYF